MLTNLFHKPVNLILYPFLPVPWIYCHLLADVRRIIRVVLVQTQHPIAQSTTSLFEDYVSAADCLDPIHDKPLDDRKLALIQSVHVGIRWSPEILTAQRQ